MRTVRFPPSSADPKARAEDRPHLGRDRTAAAAVPPAAAQSPSERPTISFMISFAPP